MTKALYIQVLLHSNGVIVDYTIFTNFSMYFIVVCRVYTVLGGINSYTMFVHLYVEIIHSLKLVDHFNVQADDPWYNYYLANSGPLLLGLPGFVC